jgi:hypothetical protein
MNKPLHITWLPEQEQTLPIKHRSLSEHNFGLLRIRQAAVSRNDSPHNKGWGRNGSWPDSSGGFEIHWSRNLKSNPFDLNQL